MLILQQFILQSKSQFMHIVVKWFKTKAGDFYEQEMRVIASNHPRFTVGYRFDFGFMTIACKEGYVVTVIPADVD